MTYLIFLVFTVLNSFSNCCFHLAHLTSIHVFTWLLLWFLTASSLFVAAFNISLAAFTETMSLFSIALSICSCALVNICWYTCSLSIRSSSFQSSSSFWSNVYFHFSALLSSFSCYLNICDSLLATLHSNFSKWLY